MLVELCKQKSDCAEQRLSGSAWKPPGKVWPLPKTKLSAITKPGTARVLDFDPW